MAATSEDKPLIAARPVSQGLAAATRAPGGKPIFVFLNSAFQSLINGRQEKWNQIVAEALVEIRNRALRNAVLHTALSDGPDEPLQLMFLRLIDYLTPLHLVTVALLNDPVAWMEKHDVPNPRWPVGTSSTVMQYCVPSLRGRPDILEMIVRDLQGAGLVEQGYFLRIPMSDAGILQSHTTDSGRRFVRFISNS